MVGRDQTVAALAALVRERRVVSIVGPGGMGKTTVAVAVAHDLADAFEGRVAFVDLALVAEPGQVVASVSSAVGARLTEPDPLLGLLAFVADQRLLIVLDNCEHLADAVAALTEQLHTRTCELHLLVTSREALRTECEQVHVLEPLEGPPDLEVEASELLAYPAAQLLMERAAAGGYREPLDAATAPLVARICHRLDGIALAIELVASRLGAYGVRGVADLLDNRFKLQWQGRRSAVPRHQTLHAMLDWSFNLLSECDRTILARLGVFAGPFDFQAVRAVVLGDGYDASDVDQALDNLVEKSLVWTCASATSPLYRLAHVTRDFALVELAKRDEKRAVEARHARHVLHRLEAAGRLGEPFGETGLAAFAPLVPSLRAALNWSFSDEGDRELTIDLAVAAAPMWLRMGRLGECRHWSERALGLLPDRDKGGAKECALQEALATSVMYTRGDHRVVAAGFERSLALAEALGEPDRLVRLLAVQHMFCLRSAAFDQVLEVSLRSAQIAARVASPKAQIIGEWMLATSYHLVGRQKDVQSHCDRGFAIAAASAAHDFLIPFDYHTRILVILARCSWLKGQWDRGVAFGRTAIQQAERGGSPVDLCVALVAMALVLLWNGSLDEADAVLGRLEKHADRHALSSYQASAQALRGELIGARGDHEQAIARLHGALARLHEENYRFLMSGALRALGEALMHVGRLDQARTVIDDAIESAQRSGVGYDLCELLRTRGEIRRRAGDQEGAEAALLAAVALADEQGAVSWRLRSGEALARLWISRGRAEQAQAETSTLSARLKDCSLGEPAVATLNRLRALSAEAERPAFDRGA
jgi:predicted ATPase